MSEQAATGRVIKILGGLYHVALPDGCICQCRLSGKVKSGGAAHSVSVLPGDMVKISTAADTPVITAVLPRRTALTRPPVANVDTCVLVQSFIQPAPAPELLEKMMLITAAHGIETVMCWTKADLVAAPEKEELLQSYAKAGYRTFITSAADGFGLAQLRTGITGSVCILCGASGVGKSSLLNALFPGLQLPTGEIGSRIARGRHTTRHTELLPLTGTSWIADTPGFSAIDASIIDVDSSRLARCYPDYARLAQECRFADCRHRDEPGCAVKQAVADGSQDAARYARYLRFLEEVEAHAAQRY